jgi:hypothetical protein
MMDMADEATKTRCLDWSTGKSLRCKLDIILNFISSHLAFKQDCSVLYAASGDDALAVGNYDRAIEIYSAAIDFDLATDTIFANRSKARSGKLLWEDALLDAEKVR